MPNAHVNGNRDAIAFESITVSTTAIGPTAATIKVEQGVYPGNVVSRSAETAFFTNESNAIRYRMDGTDPTASIGHAMASGDTLTVEGYDNIRRLRFIRQSADATIRATYFN